MKTIFSAVALGLIISPFSLVQAEAFCVSLRYTGLFQHDQRESVNGQPGRQTNNARGLVQEQRNREYCFDETKAWLRSEPEYAVPYGTNIATSNRLPSGQISNVTSSYYTKGTSYFFKHKVHINQPGEQSFVDSASRFDFRLDGSTCRLNKVEQNDIMAIQRSSSSGSYTGTRLIKILQSDCSIL